MTTDRANQIMGVPGLSVFRGVLAEEYLVALTGARKKRTYRQMLDDAVIGAMMDAIKMPLIAAPFSTEPADVNNAVDVRNAEFLLEVMNDMTHYTWRSHVLDMIDFVPWGWSWSEAAFKKRLGPKGNPASKFDDGRIGLDILDPRAQTTLDRWKFDENFNVEALIQMDPNTSKLLEVPAWKSIHATFRSTKRSPEGNAALRSIYRAWYTRNNLEVIEAIGAERDLVGLPVVHLPFGATPDDQKAAEELVRKLRIDEEAGLVIPPPPTPGAESPWKVELLASAGAKQFNVREIVRDLNKIILMRFFAQFLLLGMENVGSQALVEGSHDFFTMALESLQQELLEVWQSQLVPLVFKMNENMTNGMSALPMIKWGKPGRKDIAAKAALLSTLIGVDVVTPSAELEDFMRNLAGLPERPEGLGEGPRRSSPASMFSHDWTELSDGTMIAIPKDKKAKRRFADVDGTTGRRERGAVEKLTNEYQGRLVATYDVWAKEVEGALVNEERSGSKGQALADIVLNRHLPILAERMKDVGRKGMLEAVQFGLGGETMDAQAVQLAQERIERNDMFIDDSLIPQVRAKLTQQLLKDEEAQKEPASLFSSPRKYQLDIEGIVASLAALRNTSAGFSGGFWNAVFLGAGLARLKDDKRRTENNETPRPVRWVLDPNAEHCKDSAGFHGCAGLEGQYESWDSLPTVPAGEVTCRGNCRCGIEVETGPGQWERVA